MVAVNEPLVELTPAGVLRVLATMSSLLSDPHRVLLLHRDIVDDTLAGVLAGFLVHSGKVADPIAATVLIQEILKRPLGPEARAIIPMTTGA